METAPVRRLDANHDMTFGAGMRNIATGSEAAMQRLRCRLLSILGDWDLDQSHGIPWWQDPNSSVRPIMGAPRDLRYAESVIKKVILETNGIATIEAFASDFDGNTRQWTVRATCTTVDGQAFSFTQIF